MKSNWSSRVQYAEVEDPQLRLYRIQIHANNLERLNVSSRAVAQFNVSQTSADGWLSAVQVSTKPEDVLIERLHQNPLPVPAPRSSTRPGEHSTGARNSFLFIIPNSISCNMSSRSDSCSSLGPRYSVTP
ncbi:unnamed protein product [Aspergillus oryzae var. brunneus]|uniref:Unnamed protein product n=2 Tax=Aspergillus oryzae TaxID=5062 RepID=A0AAN4YRY3_ASPOZ|nr:unnamed protein product [Aspergillus oryzae]GMG35980.1 unnamed protein product [Aspergillus oryzae]GMG41891.1 unnamed protein product [Aspergillus oryzae var. brunneus]